MNNYRKIWERSNGKIPIDEDGRSYEIHHINGNHKDNRLENLMCISIEEHYIIHLENGDLLAAAAIATRMGISIDLMKTLNSLAGKHAFLMKKGIHSISLNQKKINSRKGAMAHCGKMWFNDGTNSKRCARSPGDNWIPGRIATGTGVPKGTVLGTFWNNGTMNVRSQVSPGPEYKPGKYLTPEQRVRRSDILRGKPQSIESKLKKSQKLKGIVREEYTCPHCGHVGRGGAMLRWHFDNCKEGIIL